MKKFIFGIVAVIVVGIVVVWEKQEKYVHKACKNVIFV